MFVHSSPALQADHDYEKIAERALNSYALGEHVAPHWDLGRVLKWRPMNVGNMSKPLGPDVDVPDPSPTLSRGACVFSGPDGTTTRERFGYSKHGSTGRACSSPRNRLSPHAKTRRAPTLYTPICRTWFGM